MYYVIPYKLCKYFVSKKTVGRACTNIPQNFD